MMGALDWPGCPELRAGINPPNPPPPNNCDNPSPIPCACDEPGNNIQNRRTRAVIVTKSVSRVILIYLETTIRTRIVPATKTKCSAAGYRVVCGEFSANLFELGKISRG